MGFISLQEHLTKCGPKALIRAAAPLLLLSLASCASFGATGPSAAAINKADGVMVANAPIKVVEVTDLVARRVAAAHQMLPFSQTVGDAAPIETVIGPGDVLQITIWEAPPAVLFGGNASFGSSGTGVPGGVVQQNSTIPQIMVDERGQIRLPFAGSIAAAGRTPSQVEREIKSRLARMAHLPQVAVQIATNASATVAVVGEVRSGGRVPIIPGGGRLLDIIAGAGGVAQPVDKVTVQVARGGKVANLPLQTVLSDPAQNIRLAPGDVVTVLHEQFSFVALGATSTSAEIPFESTGITLAQALGRMGGLKEDRANARAAFIFRFEESAAVDLAVTAVSPRTPDGRIPVIYRADLRDPTTFFAAQHFPMRDDDILYVSTAPASDLQRFVGILSSMAFTLIGLGEAIPRVTP